MITNQHLSVTELIFIGLSYQTEFGYQRLVASPFRIRQKGRQIRKSRADVYRPLCNQRANFLDLIHPSIYQSTGFVGFCLLQVLILKF